MKLIFLLDPGHGKATPGKRSPVIPPAGDRLHEYEFNRKVVAEIARLCDERGIKYHIVVPEVEGDISLGSRVRRANEYKAPGLQKVFISVHANAAGDGIDFHPAKGFEVFTTPGETKSDIVAEAILDQLKEQFPEHKHRYNETDGDKDKEADFFVLKNTMMPAVLSENGFYTNYEEVQQMLTPEFVHKVALAHVDAFASLEGRI